MKQASRDWGDDIGFRGHRPGGLSPERYSISVAAKPVDILLHPLEDELLVEQSVVAE